MSNLNLRDDDLSMTEAFEAAISIAEGASTKGLEQAKPLSKAIAASLPTGLPYEVIVVALSMLLHTVIVVLARARDRDEENGVVNIEDFRN